jgi:hypothetical protein
MPLTGRPDSAEPGTLVGEGVAVQGEDASRAAQQVQRRLRRVAVT